MSSSKRLRKTHTKFGGGKTINNKEAKQHDKDVGKIANKKAMEIIKSKYPNLSFVHKSKITKEEMCERLKQIDPVFGTHQHKKGTGFGGDGGYWFVVDKCGKERLVLATEAKKQGTNDIRLIEGKKKQSSGNAVERAHKNITEIQNWMCDEVYFPYVMFCMGCDFAEECSIPDRLTGLTGQRPLNRLYVRNKRMGLQFLQSPSIFIKVHMWGVDEMAEIMIQAVEEALCILSTELPN